MVGEPPLGIGTRDLIASESPAGSLRDLFQVTHWFVRLSI